MVKESGENPLNETDIFAFGEEADRLALAAMMGNLHPDAVAMAGIATLSAAIEAERLDEKDRKTKAGDLLREIMRVDQYLRRMDALVAEMEASIAAMVARRDELRALSQEAFERVFEAERLTDAIDDGVSEQERAELVALLGPEAETVSVAELQVLLAGERARSRTEGNDLADQATELEELIVDEESRLAVVVALHDEYKVASPERRAQIEDELDRLCPPEDRTTEMEREVEVSPDFTVAFP